MRLMWSNLDYKLDHMTIGTRQKLFLGYLMRDKRDVRDLLKDKECNLSLCSLMAEQDIDDIKEHPEKKHKNVE